MTKKHKKKDNATHFRSLFLQQSLSFKIIFYIGILLLVAIFISFYLTNEAHEKESPAILGEEFKPLPERFPEVDQIGDKVAKVIFEQLGLSKEDLQAKISTPDGEELSAVKHHVARFPVEVKHSIAKELGYTDGSKLSQEELSTIRQLAVEEEATKTTATIDGLLLARQQRFEELAEQIEAARLKQEETQNQSTRTRTGQRGSIGQDDQTSTRRRRR